MGKTSIEWTDATWNPIRGTKGRWHCTHVSEGCRNCYAERLNVRWGGPAYKPGADTFRLDEKVLEQPLHWRKPRKVFVCDMTDLFHDAIPDQWIDVMLSVMCDNGEGISGDRHTYQILTKRPLRMRDYAVSRELGELENIWLGVSVEDQATADERIPLLLQTPAAVRFVSYEPALGPVDFRNLRGGTVDGLAGREFEVLGYDNTPALDWLIIGGESGPKARPFALAWARSTIAQCRAAKVPVFVKQLGRVVVGPVCDFPRHSRWTRVAGQHVTAISGPCLQHPKGGDPSEWPKDLRVREWP